MHAVVQPCHLVSNEVQVPGGAETLDAAAAAALQGAGQIILVPYYGPGTACPDGARCRNLRPVS